MADGLRSAPLCWGQQWSWHEQQLPVRERSPGLHLAHLVELPESVDTGQIRSALRLATTRHTSLRSTFEAADGGSPQQRVCPADAEMYEFAELDGDPDQLAAFRDRSFDLASGWPLRAVISQIPERGRCLGIVTHHIATDLYGFERLCAELQEAVRTLTQRTKPASPPAGSQPVDIATYEQSAAGAARNERALAHWLRHDDALGEILTTLRGRFDRPSTSMHMARVVSRHAAPRLGDFAATARGSEGAVVVAAIACVLAEHFQRTTVPMSMLVLNRHTPDLEQSVSSLAQGGLVCVTVPDPSDLERVVPAAWSGTLAAMRHGRYDGNDLSTRMSSFESGGRHLTASPPSISIMRDRALPPLAPGMQPADDGGPYTVFTGQVDRPCLGLNFHVRLTDSELSIELRAGTHLISEAGSRELVVDAIELITG